MFNVKDTIFVFGSNLHGRHDGGAAREALDNFGAVYGQGEGLQGRSYAIPTKYDFGRSLLLDDIRKHVEKFIDFAQTRSEVFFLTPIGCGLAGFNPKDIRQFFATAINFGNIIFPECFLDIVTPESEVASNKYVVVLDRLSYSKETVTPYLVFEKLKSAFGNFYKSTLFAGKSYEEARDYIKSISN